MVHNFAFILGNVFKSVTNIRSCFFLISKKNKADEPAKGAEHRKTDNWLLGMEYFEDGLVWYT